jgi:membrane protease YdiL (CAAX protease family)
MGWLGFIAVALGLVWVTQQMPFFAVSQSEVKTKAREGDPTAAYLASLMALLAVTMVTGVFSSGFDWLYPARVLGTAAAIWFFWRQSLTRLHLARGWSWGAFSIRVVGSVVTVPIAEELAFRGYLLRRLISSDFDRLPSPRFTWLSFLVSSVLFGALHGRWLAGTVAGMFYAWAMYRRGRVGDAIIAHATTNALIAADVLILGNWSLWN